MNSKDFEPILKGVPSISSTLSQIQHATKEKRKPAVERLTDLVKKNYADSEKRPNHTASQLLKYVYEIKEGDIVIIPNENSHVLAFCQVTNSVPYQKLSKERDDCPYMKRKSIKFIKALGRNDLDPKLYKLMFSHHTITEGDLYAPFIDRILNTLFTKGKNTHLILNVRITSSIKAKDLFETGSVLLDLAEDFAKEESLTDETDSVNVKLDVQSPGLIELSATSIVAIMCIGIIVVAIAGGGFSFKYKTDVKSDIKTDGLVEIFRKFLNSSPNRKRKKEIIDAHINNLQITNLEDLIKILKELKD